MPCSCDQCRRHASTLGLAAAASTKKAIHKAYRDAVKLWHPDRFADDPSQQPDAEEKFKHVQVAYRELTEHFEQPTLFPMDAIAAEPQPVALLSFGDAPGCFTAPRLPPHVEKMIAADLGPDQKALAIVDLSPDGQAAGDFSQFLLVASHAVIVRDSAETPSILWYSDLGEVHLIDQRVSGDVGRWEKLLGTMSGNQRIYSLRIYRRSGAPFFTLAGQADDSVKKVIYNFLLRKKYEARP
jgi:DnaJ domain